MIYKKKLLVVMIFFVSNVIALPNLSQFICMCKLSQCSAVQSDVLYNMLHDSCEYKVKKWLIDFDYNTKKQSCTPKSPLLCAIQYNADNSIILVLLKESKLNNIKLDYIYDASGFSMLSIAVKNNNMQLITLLLKYDYPLTWDKNTFDSSPLHIAAEFDYLHIVNCLLPYMTEELNVHSNDTLGITPLGYIIKNNKEKYAISLLSQFYPIYSIAYLGKNSYLSIATNKKMELLTYFLNHIL